MVYRYAGDPITASRDVYNVSTFAELVRRTEQRWTKNARLKQARKCRQPSKPGMSDPRTSWKLVFSTYLLVVAGAVMQCMQQNNCAILLCVHNQIVRHLGPHEKREFVRCAYSTCVHDCEPFEIAV